jgi:hypothetical protein
MLAMKSFGTWVNLITDPAQTSPSDDPAGDSIANLLKYAAGLQPETAYPMSDLNSIGLAGDELVMTYYQATNTVGVALVPVVAIHLAGNWTVDGISVTDTGTTDVQGRKIMEARWPCIQDSGFMRLGADQD